MNVENNEQTPLIPPFVLIAASVIGFVVAFAVYLTQREVNVFVLFGLVVGVLGLLAWAVTSPEQARAAITGRTVQYGGTAFVVTAIFLAALVILYMLVRQQNWRKDFSEGQFFSLTDDIRESINLFISDPTIPRVEIVAFYDITQTGEQDRASILLDDYVDASDGKISVRFVDPDHDPLVAEQYQAQAGNIFVVRLDENGEADLSSIEPVPFLEQNEITNAIIRATALGDFRAYFIQVRDGLEVDDNTTGFGVVTNLLENQLRWTIDDSNLLDIASGDFGIDLTDRSADGEVIVIPGGTEPLPDADLQILTDYMDAGGDLVVFSAFNTEGQDSLATADNFSNYLWENFGVRVNNDLVLNPDLQVQSIVDFQTAIFGQGFAEEFFVDNTILVFRLAHSIEIAETPPENVEVNVLARTTFSGYAKEGINFQNEVTQADIEQTEDDVSGSLVVAVRAENTETGAKIVIWGSENIAYPIYVEPIMNTSATLASLYWATDYLEFFNNIPEIATQPPSAVSPLFADEQQLRNVNFVTVLLIPFGILGLGVLVWWNNREKEIA